MAIGDAKTVFIVKDVAGGNTTDYYDFKPAAGETWKVTGWYFRTDPDDGWSSSSDFWVQMINGDGDEWNIDTHLSVSSFHSQAGSLYGLVAQSWEPSNSCELFLHEDCYIRFKAMNASGGEESFYVAVSAVQIK